MTTTSALELAKAWKKLMSEAEKFLIDKEALSTADSETVLELLHQALSTIETLDREHSTLKGGPEDLRVAETLERIGFAYYCRGMYPAAESSLRRALEITEERIIGYFTATSAAQNLAKVLDKTGRSVEAEELRTNYPAFEDAPEGEAVRTEALERTFLTTLYNLFDSDETSRKVVPIMEELLGQIETVFGSEDVYTIDAMHRTGECYLRLNAKNEASELFTRALKIALARPEPNDEEISSCMRKMAAVDPQSRLGRAFTAKARALAQGIGVESLADAILSKVLAQSAMPQLVLMPLDEADSILAEWSATQKDESVPFVSLTLNEEQRYRQLLSMVERAIEIADIVEKGSEAPLSCLNLISDLAICYRELGNMEKARETKHRELKLIGDHWGEGHVMYLEALEDFEENFQ